MPSLAAFAALAQRAGVVPHVPQVAEARGTGWGTTECLQNQQVGNAVPHVPLVPLGNDDARDEDRWRDEFEERAAILEYDAGYTRAEAETLARAFVKEAREQQ
jgi:hypothetical protein